MMQTKLMPWHIATAIRSMFIPAIIALEVQAEFWKTWEAVYQGGRK